MPHPSPQRQFGGEKFAGLSDLLLFVDVDGRCRTCVRSRVEWALFERVFGSAFGSAFIVSVVCVPGPLVLCCPCVPLCALQCVNLVYGYPRTSKTPTPEG